MRLPVESAHKTAFGEKMQSATKREYNAALARAPHARPRHIDGGPRSMTVEHSDRGTLVASKTIIYSRGKKSQEMYMVNADYLPGGSMSRQAKFPKGQKMTVEEVAEYFRAAGNDKAADEWLAMHEKNKDVIKDKAKAKKQARDLLPIERRFAREDEGKMSESEKKKFLEENPALAKNVEDPPKEVEALKEKMKGKKASLRRAARRHFAGRRYDYDEVIDFLTEDKSTPELERMWKKWSAMVEDLHDRWFEGWAEANAPELLDESIDYKELAWKAFGSVTGMGIGLWEGDFLGDAHDEAFEKVVERDSKVSRFGQDLDDEISMAREGDYEESMRMASRRKSASGNHHVAPNGDIFVDTAFLNATKRIPGVTLGHMGFGEFYADTPKGRVDFDRMRGKNFPGQSGRSHKLYGEGNAAGWLLDQMIRKGQSVESGSRMAADRMLRKAFVPDSVDGWLEWEDGTRTATTRRRG